MMSYCFCPQCPQPQNSLGSAVCQSCKSPLILQGRYRGLRKLSGGAMSQTFFAVDETAANFPCVIKQFSPQYQTQTTVEKALELFRQEAIRLQDLGKHNQIPEFFDQFQHHHQFYLVEEFIEGQTLTQELETHGYFEEEKIRNVLQDLLSVLQFIHQHNVIHRDIKPDNIIRRKSDQKLVLVDFGIAKYSPNLSQPLTGTLAGTIGYAPLEQIRGGKAYPASDLYSLGMTCIQLLTQMPPNELFDPFTGELIWQSHLKTAGRTISNALNQILNQLIQDLIKDRYFSADAVLSDLNNLEEKSSVVSQPPTSLEVILNTELELEKNRFHPQTVVQDHGKRLRETGWRSFPIPSFINTNSHSQLLTVIPGQPLNLLTATQPTITLKRVRQLQGHTAPVEAIAIGPNGYILVSGSADHTIRLWNLNTGQVLHRFLGHQASVQTVAISPNGRRFVSGSLDRTILAWNLYRRALTDRFFSHSGSPYSHRCGAVYTVAYSPDGCIIASGSADHTIKLWNQRNGELLYRLYEHYDPVLCLTFAEAQTQPCFPRKTTHPQSSLFASGSSDGMIKLWRFGNLQSLQTFEGHLGGVCCLALSQKHHLLVSGSFDTTLKLWNVQTGELLRTFNGHQDTVRSVSMSLDGQWLASASVDGMVQLWNLRNSNLWGLPTNTLSAYPPVAFTPDSQQLITGGKAGDILVWSLQ